MLDLLPKLVKSGVKTSEFWVAIAAMVLPYVLTVPQDQATAWALAHGGVWAGYLVAGIYIAARGYTKGKQLEALGEPALADAQAGQVLEQYGSGVALGGDLQAIAARMAAAAPPGYRWDVPSNRYVAITV